MSACIAHEWYKVCGHVHPGNVLKIDALGLLLAKPGILEYSFQYSNFRFTARQWHASGWSPHYISFCGLKWVCTPVLWEQLLLIKVGNFESVSWPWWHHWNSLACLRFPMVATGMKNGGISLWCGVQPSDGTFMWLGGTLKEYSNTSKEKH